MKEISLYVHIPFCKQKCRYCDFPSFCGKEDFIDEYVDCLIKEINSKGKNYSYNTVFIGGGTPSYLDLENLENLLKSISSLNLNENVEFTVECNPGTLNKEKLEIMKRYKVNRLSFGLQSTKKELLIDLGRIHDFNQFKENYFLSREMGFENINIDLMFGLPNQTLEDLQDTLKEIVNLNPEHISVYSLIIEEGTVFYKLYEENKLNLPSEEIERDMYELSVEYLNKNGYDQYEISNFAKNNRECKHNLVYWEMKDYLGCGTSSASLIDGKRLKNYSDIDKYIQLIKDRKEVIEEEDELSKDDNMEEFMFLGLRKITGIEEQEFFKRFSINVYDLYKDVINKHIKNGLLIRESGKIYLSKSGVQLSNYVMSDFLLN